MRSGRILVVLVVLLHALLLMSASVGSNPPISSNPSKPGIQRRAFLSASGLSSRLPRRNASRAALEDRDEATESTTAAVRSGKSLCSRKLLFLLLGLYAMLFVLLMTSHRAQTYMIYLHWVRPPQFLFPLNRLQPYRLASSARVVSQGHLRGWHLLPPGPPFADGSEEHFDDQLGLPSQRVVIFFHGNSGTRACPSKRVDMIRLLAAHFQAHVVTFDYSGFGDSGGRPSEHQLNLDARNVFEWVRMRAHWSSDIIIYGQSLGTFAAVDLGVYLCNSASFVEAPDYGAKVVILDAPPATLVDAAMTHPIARPFRIMPYCEEFFRFILKEKLDSTAKVQQITLPLLILHGEEDATITIEQGQRLYDSARKGGHSNVEFVRFPLCGHNDVNASPTFLRVVNEFFDKHLTAPLSHRS